MKFLSDIKNIFIQTIPFLRNRYYNFDINENVIERFVDPDLDLLAKRIDVKIKNNNLFIEALTHRSFIQNINCTHKTKSNERLEFLGDSVLNLVVGEYLFKKYPDDEEGKLTKVRSRLVNRKALFEYAKKIELGQFIFMNPNAIIALPKGIESILADAFESLIAAIYLDGGFIAAKDFISKFVFSDIKIMNKAFIDDNYKSALLEHAQANGLGVPKYVTVHEEGPNHNPVFTVKVKIGENVFGDGKGRNKKEAEQEAAKDALLKLSIL